MGGGEEEGSVRQREKGDCESRAPLLDVREIEARPVKSKTPITVALTPDKRSRLIRPAEIDDNHKNEDDLKYEDDLKKEDY